MPLSPIAKGDVETFDKVIARARYELGLSSFVSWASMIQAKAK
jgi:hypothetical protein